MAAIRTPADLQTLPIKTDEGLQGPSSRPIEIQDRLPLERDVFPKADGSRLPPPPLRFICFREDVTNVRGLPVLYNFSPQSLTMFLLSRGVPSFNFRGGSY